MHSEILEDGRVKVVQAFGAEETFDPQDALEVGIMIIQNAMRGARRRLELIEKEKELLTLVAYADFSIDKIEV